MDFKFKIKVGSTEIEITESAANHKEFIQKLQFFTSLPTKGPKGAEDLKFVARKTSKGDIYYSLISEQDKAEFKLGQHKNKEETLYGKGWFDLFGTDGMDEDGNYPEEQQQAPVQVATPAPAKPAAAAPAKPAIPVAKPIIAKPNIPVAAKPAVIQEQVQEAVEAESAQEQEVQAAPAAPVAKPAAPIVGGIKRPNIPTAPAKPAAPVTAATTTPASAPAKPLPSANVNSVLAKYGINKQQ